MADQTTEKILFEIKLNGEQFSSEQALIRKALQELTLGIEKTKAAQVALKKERDLQKISDAQYAEQAVKLREQLRGQVADQRELEKGLATGQKAYQSAAGSVEQLRAALAEAKTAFYAMSEAERQSGEGIALQQQALAISDALSAIEKSVGTASRDVGKYSDGFKQGLAGVVAELVKARAAQNGFTEGSEEAARNQIRISGFQTAAQRAAAQAGITDFTQAKAVIDQYAQAFTPAVENLVQLQRQQEEAGQTVGENSEQYQQLGFKIAGAQKQLDDIVSAQAKAGQAAQGGAGALGEQAGAANVAANSLAGLRQQLLQLEQTRETLDPTTKEAQELNTAILTLRTNIQQAEGKIDEFGERVQKNIKKENFDTVNDAIQGLVGTMSAATIVFGDNTDAAAAQAKALQLMALAQNARAIAIGLDSAKDAAQIVLLKAKSLFIKEEATLTAAAAVSTEAHAAVAGADAVATEAQAAAAAANAEAQTLGTEATAANIVATEAQVVATEGATLAQRALNLAMKLNPIGLVIIAVAALVSLFAVYRNASDATQKKIRDITEAFLRFSNPIGLLYTGLEKLYQKFASVRAVLDPLLNTFNKVAGAVKDNAIAFGRYVGLLDTVAEKVDKLAAAELARAKAIREQTEAEIKLVESSGATAQEVTRQRIAAIGLELAAAEKQEASKKARYEKDITRINAQIEANKKLADEDKKPLSDKYTKIREEVEKASLAVTNLRAQQSAAITEGVERDRAARQQEAADIQTNAQRAVQNLQLRIEQQDAAENAALQRRIARIDLQLGAVQQGTVEELHLQQQKVTTQTALEIKQAKDVLAEKTRLRAVGYAQELATFKKQEKEALDAQGLTEQQRSKIKADFIQQNAEVEQKYSLVAAKQAVANIPILEAQAGATKLRLRTDFERQINAAVLGYQAEQNRAELAQAKAGTVARRELELTLINQEQELAIAALDKRAMTNLEYETRLTAIRADAVAKRRALSQQDTQDVVNELGQQQRGAELNQQRMLVGQSQFHQLQTKASQQYYNEQFRAELASYAAGTAATIAGTTERENVEKQHSLNLKTIEDERSQNEIALIAAKYDRIASLASQSISALGTFEDAASQDRLGRIKAEMNLATTSQARKAVLAKQQERIEQQQHERQKKYAIAQAIIDGGSAVMRIIATSNYTDFGVTAALEVAGAVATTIEQIRTISSQKFAQGGIAQGPSHAQGGIQLLHQGRPAGIEIEGGEPVLTAAVSRTPVLLGMASMINQLAGGRALYADPRGADTWARWADGGVVGNLSEYLPQVRTGGIVTGNGPAIDYDLLGQSVARYAGPAFVAGAKALPAPETNLTELRQRLKAEDKLEADTNI
jgi:hypothetical protein